MDQGLITKKNLEEFLNIPKNKKEKKDDSVVIQKLGLLKITIKNYDPKTSYADLKSNITIINNQIKELSTIKDSIIIFHRNQYNKEIKELTNIIEDLENKPINDSKSQRVTESITNLKNKLNPISKEIIKVKDFLLFKKIFEISQGKEQTERFKDGLTRLKNIKNLFEEKSNIDEIFNSKDFKNIFTNIKDELSKKEEGSKSNKFIKQMIDYFNIKEEKDQKNVKIIIKSKKYEMVVKSIKFFFENFSNKKINLPKNIELSIMKLNDLKRTLELLKDQNIYDYESNSNYYKVFTSIYEKKEAINFLMKKINIGIANLKEKLDPTNRSISIKDINDAIDCLYTFRNLLYLNDKEIIGYIKSLDEESINKFVSYSKHYSSIIELDRKNEKIFLKMFIKLLKMLMWYLN